MGTANDYRLTFSNFHGENAAITAFGFTITDFASNITEPVTIAYVADGLAGELLSVVGGQPDFTQNFVGLVVDPADAFTSITVVFGDVSSGFQDFDEVIFSQPTAVPVPGTLALLAIGIVALRRRGAA